MKRLYQILYGLNWFALTLMIIQIVLIIGDFLTEEQESTLGHLRMLSVLPVLVFVVWNIIIWNKRDKKTGRLIALIFLLGWYSLYYPILVFKNGWLEKEK